MFIHRDFLCICGHTQLQYCIKVHWMQGRPQVTCAAILLYRKYNMHMCESFKAAENRVITLDELLHTFAQT